MRYRVHIQFVGSTAIEVEADNEDDAIDAALELAPQNDFAYADYDAGEWYVDDDPVWPTVIAIDGGDE